MKKSKQKKERRGFEDCLIFFSSDKYYTNKYEIGFFSRNLVGFQEPTKILKTYQLICQLN